MKAWQGVQGEGVLGGDGEFAKSTAMDAGDQIEWVGLESTETNFDDGFQIKAALM